MDRVHENGLPSLRPEPSDISDYSVGSNSTVVASPPSPIQQRAAYRRVSSLGGEDFSYTGAGTLHHEEGDVGGSSHARGLGIENVNSARQPSVRRAPIGSKSEPHTPQATDTLLSPPSAQLGQSHASKMDDQSQYDQEDLAFGRFSTPSLSQPFSASSESESLHKKNMSTSFESYEPSGRNSNFHCNADQKMKTGRANWLSVTILILAIYSSTFSCIWLLLACIKPRYGQRITTNGRLPYSTASLLFAFFAKSIELSYVTVFVAFLGQVLSRRALVKKSKGITIAEMSMRSWIMQPGTMITHWETVRYAAFSFLGGLAMLTALMAMFYTTASDALVSPKLKYGPLKEQVLYGKVATQFANVIYIHGQCKTPIKDDPQTSGPTCISIEHAGQAYHNYLQYLPRWTDVIANGSGSTDLDQRPKPVAMMYDNTTVEGSWINKQNMTQVSIDHGRIINNISMAMPHTGVFAATRDPINNIMQPQDPSGLGEYHVRAAVPSPSINVLCANLSQEELAPMVFTLWPNTNGTKANLTGFPAGVAADYIPHYPSWLNRTAVDDTFGFGEKYDQRHPVFPRLPLPYNTVFNHSGDYTKTVYLLATSPTSAYMLCSLRVSQTPNCSTEYNSTATGGTLVSRCDSPVEYPPYSRYVPNATNGVLEQNWAAVASEWGAAVSLGDGISDGLASNTHLLAQLIPTTYSLNPSLPSIAEALAVLAGCTLILSTLDAPLIHHWNYSQTIAQLDTPQYQGFYAALKTQGYASGGTQPWQNLFYIVLFAVFVSNIFCLVYFMIRGGLVTDFIEPQNLFSLSINSPSSDVLDGSCGSGPEKEQFRARWHIKKDTERDHLYIENYGGLPTKKPKKIGHLGFEMDSSPVDSQYERLSSKHTSLL